MYQSIMIMESKSPVAIQASVDYKIGRLWETNAPRNKRVFEVVRVAGMDIFFRECVTEKKGTKTVGIAGKYANQVQYTAKRMGAYSLSVFDSVNNIVLPIVPAPLPKEKAPEKYPEWKVGAIVVDDSTRVPAFYEIVARTGITVTLRRRHRKDISDDGNGNGETVVDDGFASDRTYRARIIERVGKVGVKGEYGYGIIELWDGKPVQFWSD